MTQIDNSIPFSLLHLQVWMGEIISRPLINCHAISKISPSGQKLEQEASQWLNPSKTLKAIDRLEIYNQMYWWRLFKFLGDAYPSVLRILGYKHFQEKIAEAYFIEYKPNTWSIRHTGDFLPDWIFNRYHEKNKEMIYHLACVDLAIEKAIREQALSFNFSKDNLSLILSQKLSLQPHVSLFSLPGDFFQFRMELLEKDVDYWHSSSLPKLKKEKAYQFIVFRGLDHKIYSEEMSEAEGFFLELLKKGISIEEACDQIENSSFYKQIEKNLSLWIEKWFERQIFTNNIL